MSNWWRKRSGFQRVAIVVFALIVLAVAAGGGSSATTSTPDGASVAPPSSVNAPTPAGVVAAASAPTSAPAQAPAPAPPPAVAPAQAKTQTFYGSGQKALGTIVVPTDTTISWNCPSCGHDNFIIHNADSDDVTMPTDAIFVTHGVDPLPAGTYHTVVVDTASGPWTVRIAG